MQLAEVIWEDAWHESGELTQKAIADLSPVMRHSVGYLLKKTQKEVVIAAGIVNITDSEVNYCDVSVIPRGVVKGIMPLDNERNND